jgi:CRP-like cAMP-binding protein
MVQADVSGHDGAGGADLVVGALRRCPVFDALDDAELSVVADTARVVEVAAGVTVVEQGSTGDALYVIDQGSVEVLRGGEVAAKLAAGDFFGEMAMFNRAERVAAVRALEASRLIEIPDDGLQALVLRQDPGATKLVQRLGTLTLDRMQRTDDELSGRLVPTDPAAALAAAQHQQLRKRLLAGWSLAYHAIGKPGKLGIESTKPSATAADLSVAYSPGVAEPCLAIHDDPDAAYTYTSRGHLVGVISNGTAVLGLGNIGALASKPVMEGKAILFKRFADVDAYDIEVDETDPAAFVRPRRAARPDLRWYQPRGHRRPALFLDRAGVPTSPRHPGDARRPARHRDHRRCGVAQRHRTDRQAHRGREGGVLRRWRGGGRLGAPPDLVGCPAPARRPHRPQGRRPA